MDPAQVLEGQRLEMEWKVFTNIPLEQALREQGRLHDTKWISTQRGEPQSDADCGSQDHGTEEEDEKLDPSVVFAAMPPIDGVKALISHLQTEQRTKDKGQHSLKMRPTPAGHLAPVGVSGNPMAPKRNT